jgi:hypothetical protein
MCLYSELDDDLLIQLIYYLRGRGVTLSREERVDTLLIGRM